jgi:hypothetical protein
MPDPSTELVEAAVTAINRAIKGGKRVKPRKGRLTLFAIATYAVYGVFTVLIGTAIWAWIRYIQGDFSPSDTAFLAAESTLLLAAAAILVIVFEIEKTRKARFVGSRRKGLQPPPAERNEPTGQQHL